MDLDLPWRGCSELGLVRRSLSCAVPIAGRNLMMDEIQILFAAFACIVAVADHIEAAVAGCTAAVEAANSHIAAETTETGLEQRSSVLLC